MQAKNKIVKYKSSGIVLGKLWGGGEGGYSARKLEAKTKEDLLAQAKKGLDGSLDSGMGFERLCGALLDIVTVTTVEIDGDVFLNEKNESQFIGELTEDQRNDLEEMSFNM